MGKPDLGLKALDYAAMNGTPSEPSSVRDAAGRPWRKVSQYGRHRDHPPGGPQGHPNEYWVCPDCDFHVVPAGTLSVLDDHDCDVERVRKIHDS